ncbi:MAG: DUF5684 domain-containing protein [Clostridiales bacterium]|nr:DUF5684 domain-containing protein [Clostridiales bacterium]
MVPVYEFMPIFAAAIGAVLVLAVIWYILQAIAYWKIFTKAGEPGWKSLIPIYNLYTQYKITWDTHMYWLLLICSGLAVYFSGSHGFLSYIGSALSLVTMVINLISTWKYSRAFGHGVLFALGLLFFAPVFQLILGFGSSEYVGPQNDGWL